MPHRRDALDKSGDCNRVLFGKVGESMPGHDGCKDAAIRSHSLLQRRDDLLRRPIADPGVLIWRDVSPGECAETRNLERHIRSPQELRHIWLAEEISGRMTIVASTKSNQIFSPIDLRVSAIPCHQGGGRCDVLICHSRLQLRLGLLSHAAVMLALHEPGIGPTLTTLCRTISRQLLGTRVCQRVS